MAKTSAPAKRKSKLRETVEVILWALLMAALARSFLIQAFRIPSESMRDTLLVGDFLFVNKFLYGPKIPFTDIRLPGLRAPRPGDIIVFKFPDQDDDYIKRCIAVEDTKRGLLSATNAGIDCLVVPTDLTRMQDFPNALAVEDEISAVLKYI